MLLSLSHPPGHGTLRHGQSGVQAARRHDTHPAGLENATGCNRGEDTSGACVCVCVCMCVCARARACVCV